MMSETSGERGQVRHHTFNPNFTEHLRDVVLPTQASEGFQLLRVVPLNATENVAVFARMDPRD